MIQKGWWARDEGKLALREGTLNKQQPCEAQQIENSSFVFLRPRAALPPHHGPGGRGGGCFWVSCEECCVIRSVFAVALGEAAGQMTQDNG